MPRRVVVDENFNPSVTDASEESLQEGQVRVRVSRAGVNFWEVMQRRGRVPGPPSGVPGMEGAGVVTEVGRGVTDIFTGARVAWSKVPGSYSETIVAPAEALTVVPDAVDDDTAAGLLFQGATEAFLADESWPIRKGEAVVVTAASGGVGLLLTQLLVARGAEVVGLVSADGKAAAVRDAGAQHVLVYSSTISDEIRALYPTGVSAVYDAIGGDVAEGLVASLRPRGAMVLYGSASGREASISAQDLSAGSLFLTRAAGRDYLPTTAEVQSYSRALLDLAVQGRLKTRIDAVMSLEDASKAWDALESRSNVGKVLLAP